MQFKIIDCNRVYDVNLVILGFNVFQEVTVSCMEYFSKQANLKGHNSNALVCIHNSNFRFTFLRECNVGFLTTLITQTLYNF